MQLKNRIKNIEREMNINASEFCDCYGIAPTSEVLPITIDEFNRRFETGEDHYQRLPDFCDHCKKPVDKRFLIETFEQAQDKVNQRLAQITERQNLRNVS